MSQDNNLSSSYEYRKPYVEDVNIFSTEILHKKVIPRQVEIQPGPLSKKICWLDCPFCYGKSAKDTGERLPLKRYTKVINDIANGGCKKIIVAGWATDPLNYKHIDELVSTIVSNKMIVGFNTRAIRVSDQLINTLSSNSIVPESYFSVSVDSGSNQTYNKVHGVKSRSKIYDRVLKNIQHLISSKSENGTRLDVSATYLVNKFSFNYKDITSFINDFKAAGCDILRFSFPQIPRGDTRNESVSNIDKCNEYIRELRNIIKNYEETNFRISLIEPDGFTHPRTLPCVARFVYPTIGFDGWLYHCSQSAGPNFRSMALGNLADRDFWDIFYNYSFENKKTYFESCSKEMVNNGCRCDRKEHTVNQEIGCRI